MFSRPALNRSLPRQSNEHVPRPLVVRLLDPLVPAKPLLYDQVVPDDSELLLTQIVGWTNAPYSLVRLQQVPRNHITGCHRRLSESTSACREPKPGIGVVVRPLLPERLIPNRVEVGSHGRCYGHVHLPSRTNPCMPQPPSAGSQCKDGLSVSGSRWTTVHISPSTGET